MRPCAAISIARTCFQLFMGTRDIFGSFPFIGEPKNYVLTNFSQLCEAHRVILTGLT